MWIGMNSHTPADVIGSLRTHDIGILELKEIEGEGKSSLKVSRGKTNRAKIILRELGITVYSDIIQNGKLNKDIKLLKKENKMTKLGKALENVSGADEGCIGKKIGGLKVVSKNKDFYIMDNGTEILKRDAKFDETTSESKLDLVKFRIVSSGSISNSELASKLGNHEFIQSASVVGDELSVETNISRDTTIGDVIEVANKHGFQLKNI